MHVGRRPHTAACMVDEVGVRLRRGLAPDRENRIGERHLREVAICVGSGVAPNRFGVQVFKARRFSEIFDYQPYAFEEMQLGP
jgi:hypothetical protein